MRKWRGERPIGARGEKRGEREGKESGEHGRVAVVATIASGLAAGLVGARVTVQQPWHGREVMLGDRYRSTAKRHALRRSKRHATQLAEAPPSLTAK